MTLILEICIKQSFNPHDRQRQLQRATIKSLQHAPLLHVYYYKVKRALVLKTIVLFKLAYII